MDVAVDESGQYDLSSKIDYPRSLHRKKDIRIIRTADIRNSFIHDNNRVGNCVAAVLCVNRTVRVNRPV
jgi:hypothetical protein